MTPWPDYLLRAQALEKVDAKLSTNPDDVDTLFERARLLTDLGRLEEARNAYMAVIQRAPDHFGALNNLGGNLHATGFRTAARTAYAEAVNELPGDTLALIRYLDASAPVARILDAAHTLLRKRAGIAAC